MKNLLFIIFWSLSSATAIAQSASSSLIIVEDLGGVSALHWYQALTPQKHDGASPITSPTHMITHSEAEAAMLPVRSTLLTPGDEPSQIIHAPGMLPLFLIGEDTRSRSWLAQNRNRLRELNAVGLVVNVTNADELAALRRIASGLTLSPSTADDLAQRLRLHHYPVLITAAGIEP